MQGYRTAISGLVCENIPFGPVNTMLLCDVSTGQPRPIVLPSWRHRIFELVHGLSHPSIRATKTLMAAKFTWQGLRKQVVEWARTCIPCQTSKIQRHTKAPLQSFELPDRRFDHIHVDIVGLLPQSRGSTHFFHDRESIYKVARSYPGFGFFHRYMRTWSPRQLGGSLRCTG